MSLHEIGINARKWFTYSRVEIHDIRQVILDAIDPDTEIKIGTDAQRSGTAHNFVTVLILYKPGKGGRVLYSKDRVTRKLTLWDKLSTETWKSLEVAMMVEEIIGNRNCISVHVDATDDPQFKSSDYVKQLCGMVVGSGFKSVIKPDAAASSHAADAIVKNKHIPNVKERFPKRKSRRQK